MRNELHKVLVGISDVGVSDILVRFVTSLGTA